MPSKARKVRAGIDKSWDSDLKSLAVLTADKLTGRSPCWNFVSGNIRFSKYFF
jgi:hypothetical protein